MKILITGANGFIGTNLINELLKNKKYKLYGVDIGVKKKYPKKNIKIINCDLKNFNKLKKNVKKIHTIIHLASETSVLNSLERPLSSFNNNVILTANILELARILKIKKIIFASTGGAIIGKKNGISKESDKADPESPYGAYKHISEILNNTFAKCFNIKFINLRFSNVYGPFSDHKNSFIAKLFKNTLRNKTTYIFGNGSQSRDFIYVKDVVKAIIKSLNFNKNDTFNISFGKSYNLKQIIQLTKRITKNNFKLSYKKFNKGEVLNSSVSNEKAKNKLKFKPSYSLKRGLTETWDWFKNI